MCILFRLCNQLISELRMGQTDDALCPFPGGLAFCIKFTVLCHQPVQVGAGGSDHGSLQQGGTDAGFQLAALFILDRGGTADEALTALREISTQHKILLPPAPEMWRVPEDSEDTCP